VYVAFFIAWEVTKFVRSAVPSIPKSHGYEENFTPEQEEKISKKIVELGDRDSFDE
jgi:hypothetical protein